MLRWAFPILCLFLASLTVTTAVHAGELSGVADIDCTGYIHNDGDADQSPGDADKAVPHHHGNCQGMVAFLPGKGIATDTVAIRAASPFRPKAAALGRWISGPDLKPPIA